MTKEPADNAPSSSGRVEPFSGPLRSPKELKQPRWATWCTDWNAYDVPRLWDSVQNESDPRGWEQVDGFKRLSSLLEAQARRLMTLRTDLADAWPAEQSPAAAAALARVDGLIEGMLADSQAAATTAVGLHGIMNSLLGAKLKIQPLTRQWDDVTTDWMPEGWDSAAARLNAKARSIMINTEKAVHDYSTQLIVPTEFRPWASQLDPLAGPEPGNGPTQGSTRKGPTASGAVHAPPPMPGYPPVTGNGPDLDGIPTPVPAVPGQPVSMLPIPPGSQYAPNGGAYILPGPGVGRGGYVVPMPKPGTSGGLSGAAGAAARAGAGAGMMPMPMPLGGQQGKGGGGAATLYRRQADTLWQVAQGVAPVIEAPGPDQAEHVAAEETEEAFRDWFTELAMPWRLGNEPLDQAPLVTIRRGVREQ